MIKKNVTIILITLLLYFFNQMMKSNYSNVYIYWFMNCYFNDMIGGMTFMSYVNIWFEIYKRPTKSLLVIEVILFICGLYWEIITPMYRADTVGDCWDIVAYMAGGILYWVIGIKLFTGKGSEITLNSGIEKYNSGESMSEKEYNAVKNYNNGKDSQGEKSYSDWDN